MELLIGMLLSSIVLAGLVWEFGFTSRTRGELDQLVEAQQGARATISSVTQELRQAGACLPRTGDLVSIDGNDSGVRDTLILRMGKVRTSDLVCIRTVLTASAAINAATISVQDKTGFKVDDRIYIRNSSGNGEFYTVAAIGTSSTITLKSGLTGAHTSGDGFYAIEERSYSVDATSNPPVLKVSVDGGTAQPLVNGVEEFNVRYITTPCPPCAAIDQPSTDNEWLLVREVAVQVTIRSSEKNRDGEYVRLETRSNIKPRNLL